MSDAAELARFLEGHQAVMLLTGAGISTDSGIPDYRDENGQWKHAKPVQYQDFISSHSARKRYWARSMLGWPRMRKARPNSAHQAVTALQAAGLARNVITQNVDGLHQQAGTRSVTDLHGNLDRVICLNCDWTGSRADFQQQLQSQNPGFSETVKVLASAPDGDAQLDTADTQDFQIPACEECAGTIKPDVVFFGETVPADRVALCYAAADAANALLVVGSSLIVFSGFRFARHMHKADKPVALLNRGHNRASELAALKIDADCGATLVQSCQHLGIRLD